jgi:hypothetical protein
MLQYVINNLIEGYMNTQQVNRLWTAIQRYPEELLGGGHLVYTPRKLTKDIISKIDVKDKDILVLFNVEFVMTLVYDYDVAPSRITFLTDHDQKNDFLKNVGVNTFINKLEESITMKKFDIVVGNPPYQNGKDKVFYRSFVKKSVELSSGIVAMITPASWNTGGLTGFKTFLFNNGLNTYRYLGNKIFNAQNDVCYFIMDVNKKDSIVTVISEDNRSTEIDVSIIPVIPNADLFIISILEKLVSKKTIASRYFRPAVNPEQLPSGSHPCVVHAGIAGAALETIDVIAHPFQQLDDHKVICAYNGAIGKFGPAKYLGPGVYCGYATVGFTFVSKIEADNFIKFTETSLFKKIITNVKVSIQNSKNICEMIPDLDWSRSWNNAELNIEFNFKGEEIDYLQD